MASGLERISGSAKAIWTLITIGVSVVTAITSTAVYINNLISKVSILDTKVSTLKTKISTLEPKAIALEAKVSTLEPIVVTMSTQLRRVSAPLPPGPVDYYNGSRTQQCEPGTFVVGLRIGIGDNNNPRGNLVCAKVQPALD
jgi:hypothetical protein